MKIMICNKNVTSIAYDRRIMNKGMESMNEEAIFFMPP
jgi:hypothetical protein